MKQESGPSNEAPFRVSPLLWCPTEDEPLGEARDRPHHADNSPGPDEQMAVTRRYDRIAPWYDLMAAPMEWLGTGRRRRRLLAQARGKVLEAGVGTGKNLGLYPDGVAVMGIDVSPRMLARARSRAAHLERSIALDVADVAKLPHPDDTFDTSVATCLFCSVADPVAGLRELGRVTKPDGRVLLLEHVRPRNRFLGWLADLATVVTRRLCGFRANRRTEENVAAAGLEIIEMRRNGIWREMVVVVRQSRPPLGDMMAPFAT